MKNKIAILYICTGKYTIFWKEFYESAERYFLNNSEKHYFIFTDTDPAFFDRSNERIHVIPQKKLGWPYDTLLRFKMFIGIENQLEDFDFIFFLNANMIFLQDVDESILPDNQQKLLGVLHPGFFNKKREQYTYETNPLSLAFIRKNEGAHYFMGGFNGGKSMEYLKLIKTLDGNIEADLKKNIIAIWHDESHINRYFIEHKPKVLSPAFGYPEGADLPFDAKIIILHKEKFGGHDFLREIKREKSAFRRIKSRVIKFIKK